MLQRLEEEGIKAYLKDEHTVTIDPILSNAIGGIKLMVFREQAERALELITSFEEAYNKAVVCPGCRSTNMHFVTQSKNVTNWFTAIVTWLFGNYALPHKKVYRCFNCGHESESMPN
jgi:hypothetical protein